MDLAGKIKVQNEAQQLIERLGVESDPIPRMPIAARLMVVIELLKQSVVSAVRRLWKPVKSAKKFAMQLMSDGLAKNSDFSSGVSTEALNEAGQAFLDVNDRFTSPRGPIAFFGSPAKARNMMRKVRTGKATAHYVHYNTKDKALLRELDNIHVSTQRFKTLSDLQIENYKSRTNPRAAERLKSAFEAAFERSDKSEEMQRLKAIVDNSKGWHGAFNIALKDGVTSVTYAQYVIYHELGHRLHSDLLYDENNKALNLITSLYRSGVACAIGAYAQTNESEYFAESFAIYMMAQIEPSLVSYLHVDMLNLLESLDNKKESNNG